MLPSARKAKAGLASIAQNFRIPHRILTDAEKLLSDVTGRGITVTEIRPRDRVADLIPHTTAAFIGHARRGPLNTPVLLHDVGEFRRRFGGGRSDSGLAPAVRDFFAHGGRRLYVVRVVNGARGASIRLPASRGVLKLRALEPGSAECLRAAVDYDGIGDREHFNLTLQRIERGSGHVIDQEYFDGLSPAPAAAAFVGEALLSSTMVRSEMPLPAGRPEATLDPRRRGGAPYIGHSEEGNDGAVLSDYDLIGSTPDGTGLFALDDIDGIDILYMPPPAADVDVGATALLAAERYCRMRRAMLLIDPPGEWESAAAAVRGLRQIGYASPNMLGYFPRIRDVQAEAGSPQPAGGAIAGLLSRLDECVGPWASLDRRDLALRRRFRPLLEIDDEDREALTRAGLNVLVGDAAKGLRVAGDRSLSRGADTQYGQAELRVQRFCLYLVKAIDLATRWTMFEAPDPKLVQRVQAQVHAALRVLADRGAFADEDFDVRCRIDTTPSARAHAIEMLLAFTPTGSDRPIALTLCQSVAGCRVRDTVFAPVRASSREAATACPASWPRSAAR